MKKAGIGFGLTNIKAFWLEDDGQEVLVSTAEYSRESLIGALMSCGITDLCVAGNGLTHGFSQWQHHRIKSDPLTAEISTQSNGALHLLNKENIQLSPRHMVVSIGTGTSYTLRDGNNLTSLLGSSIGAGTVSGLLATWGLESGAAIDTLLSDNFQSFDLMLVDVLPKIKGTPLESFVASSFALATARMFMERQGGVRGWVGSSDERYRRAAASAVNLLVVDVVRSLLLHDKNPECAGVKDVVVLGTMPNRSLVVGGLLKRLLTMIGKNPIFPRDGEYALAVGAYHDINP